MYTFEFVSHYGLLHYYTAFEKVYSFGLKFQYSMKSTTKGPKNY